MVDERKCALLDENGFIASSTGRPLEQVTYKEKILSLVREVERRRRVYPHVVASGKASQAEVDAELQAMEAVLADLWDNPGSHLTDNPIVERDRRRKARETGADPLKFIEPQERAA